MKRNIAVVTSSRADYNHLYLLVDALYKSKFFNLSLIITGMHTMKKYGETYKEIVKDGYKPYFIIETKQRNTADKDILSAMSNQLKASYQTIKKINADMIIVLGDRYDMYPLALTAHIMGIPLAHFHGGEVTTGAIDDAIRHSVSKLSDIHFVANDIFKNRLIQMGERKKYIFNVGSLGVDAIKQIKFKKRSYVESLIPLTKKKQYFMISMHPETINSDNIKLISNTIKSLDKFKDYIKIFSYPNSDTESNVLLKEIKRYVKSNNNSILIKSFGRIDYLHLLKYAAVLIGNSSSGLVEAPFLQIPSVNIGNRQNGRPKSSTVFDTNLSTSVISNIINKALCKKLNNKKISYSGKNNISRVMKVLRTVNLTNIKKKKFVDTVETK